MFLRGDAGWKCLAVAALGASCYASRVLLQARLRARMESLFYRGAIESLLSRPLAYTKEADAEALIFGNADTFVRHEADTVPGLWGESLAAVTFAVALVVEQPERGLIAAFAVALVGGVVVVGGRAFANREATRSWERFTDLLRLLMSSVLGRVEIAAHGNDASQLSRLDAKLVLRRSQAFRIEWMTTITGRGTVALALLVVIAVFASSGRSPLETAATALILLQPFAGVVQRTLEVTRTRSARRTIDELLSGASDTKKSGRDHEPCPSHAQVITFKEWAGGYTAGYDALVIDALAMSRDDGAMLLDGANGSGKSTLLRALVGLLAHERGTVTIDEVALDAIDPREWKRHVAYLPQRPHMPAQGTIRDAFAFLHPDADDGALRDALASVELEVQLDDDVNALSAGQRQRLAIARVLLRDADLVLLDEPDQNLDRRGLQLLTAIVRELATRRLVIIAAHDPEILAIEGRHVTLEKGRIVRDEIKAPASGGTRRSQATA